MDRTQLTKDTETLGRQVAQLKQRLLGVNAPYTAGIVRAAEDALKAAYDGLSDTNTPEDQL